MSLIQRIKRLITATDAERRREQSQREWNEVWSRQGSHRPWMGRGVAKEVVESIESGWFAKGSRSIDIGCGEGELTGYFAEQGLWALGVDISDAAIARALKTYGHLKSASFAVHDICQSVPRGGPFSVVIDRGCLHQIAVADRPAYRKHLIEMTTANAHMLLFVRAFRDGAPYGGPAEREQHTRTYVEAVGPSFKLIRSELTFLDTNNGTDPATALGGIVFWFERV